MKKLINDPDRFATESLEGLLLCHPDVIRGGDTARFVCRVKKAIGKVAIISGGGSGHEPMHTGFVGFGMLDAACPGEIFSSPTPDQIAAAANAVDCGRGLLFIVKNYTGDVMNFDMARDLLSGFDARLLRVSDDVANIADDILERRGIAGTIVLEKLVGAAAEQGAALDDLFAIGERAAAATRSMGLALTSCTVPSIGEPMFPLGEGEIEIGVGIHGERGWARAPMQRADSLMRQLIDPIMSELAPLTGRHCLLIVNGLGATPQAELYLAARGCLQHLKRCGIVPKRSLVGCFASSLDAAGCSVTLSFLDDEMLALWDAPVHTAALRWGV